LNLVKAIEWIPKVFIALLCAVILAIVSISGFSKKVLLVSDDTKIAYSIINEIPDTEFMYSDNYFITRLHSFVYDIKQSVGFSNYKITITENENGNIDLLSYHFAESLAYPDSVSNNSVFNNFVLKSTFNERFLLQNIKKGNSAEVLQWLKKCPEKIIKNYYLAVCYSELKNNKMAEFYLNQITEKEPKHIVLKSKIELNKGNYKEAYSALIGLINESGITAEIYYQIGLCAYELGKYDEAISYFKSASELDPENADIWHEWGDALAILSKNEESIEKYKQALLLYPFDAFAFNNLAQVYDNEEDYENAIVNYKKALALDPNNPLFNFNLGDNYIKTENYAEAILFLKNAIKSDSTYIWAWHHLGDALFETGNTKEGMSILLKTLEWAPDSFRFHNNVASKYIALKQLDKAEVAIKKAIELNPYFAISWSTYAEIEHYKGNKKGYIEKTIKAVENGFPLKNYIDLVPDVYYKNEPEIIGLLQKN
jgi:tetratricopeptide (TPR) repeat protein